MPQSSYNDGTHTHLPENDKDPVEIDARGNQRANDFVGSVPASHRAATDATRDDATRDDGMFENFASISRSTLERGASSERERRPFADLRNDASAGRGDSGASRASTVELRRGARWARDDFVETPAALRKRVESLDAFGTVRRTEDATPASFAAETTTDGGRMTEEFDRKRALTPYYGEMRGERVACGVVQTPETESVGEAMRRETRRRAEASEGYGARGAVLEVLLWRDAARSAIHFTIGMTMLLFVRLAPRSTVSGVSLTAYASMAYLAYKYVWAVMFPRLSYGLELNDRAVGDMAQRWAISFNVWASRHRGVLAGRDNSAVFRTFLALYAVSALGHVMSAWAVATTLWVGAFTVPPFFDAYRYSITNAYVTAHIFTSSRFNALSAPKRWIGGLLLGAFAFASVNVKARFCLSFLALVAFRMFRETHVKELAAFENIVRSASRRVSRSMNEFAMILSPAARHRR